MALTAIDRSLLQRCLKHEAGSWNDFVDRFLGLVYHVIHHAAYLRSQPVSPEVVEDIAQEILTRIAADKYALLRNFGGKSSLATYLTVIARRIAVVELTKRTGVVSRKPLPAEFQTSDADKKSDDDIEEERPRVRAGMSSLDLLQKVIKDMPKRERKVVQLFYFEMRTFEDISIALDLPVKEIRPILKRAKQMLRDHEGK